nr:MAG TPA: BppU domain protein [Caudoviricetes sp.]
MANSLTVKQAVQLSMTLNGVPPTLHMVQGDTNSRTIVATLWDGAQLYSIPAGAAIMVRFRKPDGTGGLYDATEGGNKVSYAGSIVTAPVATQMLAVAGDVFAEIDIFGSSSGAAAERLATFRFIVEVAPCVLPDAQIISSDYYNILAADIAGAKAAADQAKDYAAAAKNSADSAAVSVEGAVKYNAQQTLTEEQKEQARANIGAPAPYTAGDGIAISGSVIATKAFPCNPNLLVNWYLGNPVNQRDVGGTISSAGYFLDRWKLVSGSVTIGTDGITLNGTMQQVLETAPPGTVTASALTPAGVGEVVPTYDSANKTVTVTAAGKKLVAVKLELGSQQTLAHQENGKWVLNEIPDYGEELIRCMRYLQIISTPYDTSGNGVAIGYANNTVDLWVPIPLAVPMRISPTPTIPTGGVSLCKVGKTSGTLKDVTKVTGGWAMQTGGACTMRSLIFASSGLTAGDTYALFMQKGAQIVFSAEL